MIMKIYEKDIIELICREYSISEDEFYSNFKYGSLPEARQLYCLVLKSLVMRNMDIADITGFSRPRVTQLINTAVKLMDSIPYFKQKHDIIVNKILNSESK